MVRSLTGHSSISNASQEKNNDNQRVMYNFDIIKSLTAFYHG